MFVLLLSLSILSWGDSPAQWALGERVGADADEGDVVMGECSMLSWSMQERMDRNSSCSCITLDIMSLSLQQSREGDNVISSSLQQSGNMCPQESGYTY